MERRLFMGLQIKKSKWEIINGSLKKATKSVISKISSIEIHASSYKEEGLYAVILLVTGEYCTCAVDSKSSLEEGDLMDPSSLVVYQLTNGEKVITRCNGKPLK